MPNLPRSKKQVYEMVRLTEGNVLKVGLADGGSRS